MTERRPPLQANPQAGHPLIHREEDLTPAWLTAVLQAWGLLREARVTGVRTQPIGNGLLGLNLRIELDYDRAEPGAPASLVAKMSATRAESRASGAMFGLYVKETRFYQELAPRIREGLPVTYFADVSDDGDAFCLLFEDLTPARGGDQLTGCGLADAEAAMDAAAALHAPLWGDEKALALPWLNRDFMVSVYCDKLPAVVEPVAERFAKLLEPGVIEVVRGFAERIGRYFALHDGPWTISHQDFRLDNMLFDARGGAMRVAVLDWQTFLPGPGVLDASYFLGAGLLRDVRRAHEQALMRRYHERLCALGVQGYGWEQCWRDYRFYAANGLILGVVGAAITSPTERGDLMLSTMINRHARQMIDLDTLSLIA